MRGFRVALIPGPRNEKILPKATPFNADYLTRLVFLRHLCRAAEERFGGFRIAAQFVAALLAL
jgi:hypothetical protein